MKRKLLFLAFPSVAFLLSCSMSVQPELSHSQIHSQNVIPNATAVFAGGCFWCTEEVFERLTGVSKVVSGYSGGSAEDADYSRVSAGSTDHAEAIKIDYDSTQVNYDTLLEVFFKGAHDPTTLNRQGPDVGRQYRSAVFYKTLSEKVATENAIEKLEMNGYFDDPIVTEISKLQTFYPAEDYHQDYYRINPNQVYVTRVSRPKVEKFMKLFPHLIKDEYKK